MYAVLGSSVCMHAWKFPYTQKCMPCLGQVFACMEISIHPKVYAIVFACLEISTPKSVHKYWFVRPNLVTNSGARLSELLTALFLLRLSPFRRLRSFLFLCPVASSIHLHEEIHAHHARLVAGAIPWTMEGPHRRNKPGRHS